MFRHNTSVQATRAPAIPTLSLPQIHVPAQIVPVQVLNCKYCDIISIAIEDGRLIIQNLVRKNDVFMRSLSDIRKTIRSQVDLFAHPGRRQLS